MKLRTLKDVEGAVWIAEGFEPTIADEDGGEELAEMQDKDYRGILAGLLVGGTFAAIVTEQVTGNPVPALEALLTLTGMAVAWYFKK